VTSSNRDGHSLSESVEVKELSISETIGLWWRLRRPTGNRLAMIIVFGATVLSQAVLDSDLRSTLTMIAIVTPLIVIIGPLFEKKHINNVFASCLGSGTRLEAIRDENPISLWSDPVEFIWVDADNCVHLINDKKVPVRVDDRVEAVALGACRSEIRAVKFGEVHEWKPARCR